MKAYFVLLLSMFTLISFSQNANKALPSNSTLVLLGYDTVCFYSTSFPQVSNITKGKLHDSIFILTIIDSLKTYTINKDYSIIIKPTPLGEVMSDFKYLVDLFNVQGIEKRKIDSLNTYEQTFFNTSNIPNIIGELTPMKLNLPKEEDANVTSINKDKSITLILGKDNVIYAYKGKVGSLVKKFTYASVRDYIIENKKIFNSKEFTIIIKPSADANYKNTIDILDEMSINSIKKYVLIDITEEDIKLLKSLN